MALVNLFIMTLMYLAITMASGSDPRSIIRRVLPGEHVTFVYRLKDECNTNLVWNRINNEGKLDKIEITRINTDLRPNKFFLKIDKALKSSQGEYAIFCNETMLSHWYLKVADVKIIRMKVMHDKSFTLNYRLRRNISGNFVWKKQELNGQSKKYSNNDESFVKKSNQSVSFHVNMASESFVTNYTLLINDEPIAMWFITWGDVRFEKITAFDRATVHLKYTDPRDEVASIIWEKSSVGQRPYTIVNDTIFSVIDSGSTSSLFITQTDDTMHGNFQVYKDGKMVRIWYLKPSNNISNCEVTIYEDGKNGDVLGYTGSVEYHVETLDITIKPRGRLQNCLPRLAIQTEKLTDIYVDSNAGKVIHAKDGILMSDENLIHSTEHEAELAIQSNKSMNVYNIKGNLSIDSKLQILIVQKLRNPVSISYINI